MVARNKAKSSFNTKSTGSIRIIAGKYRGRKLPVLNAEGLRPTTDRVKETLFNWLMPYINGANCLDCFAGSGGLGVEALSRGAEQVTFIELNKQAAQQLKQNLSLIKVVTGQVLQTDSVTFLNKTKSGQKEAFDVVFIDPPFRKGLLTQVIPHLTQGWLADNALIYVESEVEFNCNELPVNWRLLKEKIAGQVAYRLYQNC